MSEFEDHDWECRRDNTAANPWLWEVFRDGILVGYLQSSHSGFLSADNAYEAYDTEGTMLTPPSIPFDDSQYTNALRLINQSADEHLGV